MNHTLIRSFIFQNLLRESSKTVNQHRKTVSGKRFSTGIFQVACNNYTSVQKTSAAEKSYIKNKSQFSSKTNTFIKPPVSTRTVSLGTLGWALSISSSPRIVPISRIGCFWFAHTYVSWGIFSVFGSAFPRVHNANSHKLWGYFHGTLGYLWVSFRVWRTTSVTELTPFDSFLGAVGLLLLPVLWSKWRGDGETGCGSCLGHWGTLHLPGYGNG